MHLLLWLLNHVIQSIKPSLKNMFNNQFNLRETWREFELKSEGKNSFEKCIILIFGAVAVTLLCFYLMRFMFSQFSHI